MAVMLRLLALCGFCCVSASRRAVFASKRCHPHFAMAIVLLRSPLAWQNHLGPQWLCYTELSACVQTLDNKIKEYEVERHALFFTDADAKRIYKESVKYTVLRKNSVNGRIYKDDPTIFSWGLLNEPRCETWKVCICREPFPSLPGIHWIL